MVQTPGPFLPKSSLIILARPSKTAAICLRDRFVSSASCLNISDFVRPLGDFFTVMAAPSRNGGYRKQTPVQGGRVERDKANVNQNSLENEGFFLPACSWPNGKYILLAGDARRRAEVRKHPGCLGTSARN